MSGYKDIADSHKQGTPLQAFLKGAYLTSDGSKCVVSFSRTPTSTKAPNLPAAPDSLLPLQDVFLAVANASGSPLEKNLATFIYLDTYEAAAQKILDLEQAASRYAGALCAAHYQRRAAEGEQQPAGHAEASCALSNAVGLACACAMSKMVLLSMQLAYYASPAKLINTSMCSLLPFLSDVCCRPALLQWPRSS
jgi:hypothetical protein